MTEYIALRPPEHSIAPLQRLSQADQPTIHRFFDTSPLSPSGRLVALFRFAQDQRPPTPGESGQVIVSEWATGQVIWRSPTCAWDTQLGAQVQWGQSDSEVLFNRMATPTDADPQARVFAQANGVEDWKPFGVCVDPKRGIERALEGTVYMANPVNGYIVSPCLRRIAQVQPGYGVVLPKNLQPRNTGFPEDDGVFVTDITSGSTRLLISLAEIVRRLPDTFRQIDPKTGGLYTFHTKWNLQGTRLMVVLRWVAHNQGKALSKSCLVTMAADGTDLHMAIDFDAWLGGHHPNWCPDGDTIIMNLRNPAIPRRHVRAKRILQKLTNRLSLTRRLGLRYFSDVDAVHLTRFRFDGHARHILALGRPGSGHPSLNPAQTHVLTDAYLRECSAYQDATVPLRWIKISSGQETELVRISAKPHQAGPQNTLRIDPHPAWTRDTGAIVFNGAVNGIRQVFMMNIAPDKSPR